MAALIYAPKKARVFSFWKFALVFAALLMPHNARAADTGGSFQTVYQDVGAASYYAAPDDPNFVPEVDFMQRTDSLNYDDNIGAARDALYAQKPGVSFAERPAVICRDFGCTRLNDRITRTFLFNSIANMFMTNTHSRLFICEADPFSRSCLQSGISFPSRVGVANAMIKIPKATINQVNVSTGLSKATIGINFDFLLNGVGVQCDPAEMDIVVPANSQATLMTREFSCNMTSDGVTNVSLMINIDYIDLDFGLIGGYYSLGLQGPATGGGTGYALFKTEFSNKGMKFQAATTESQNQMIQKGGGNGTGGSIQIQPGEYAVEPVQK